MEAARSAPPVPRAAPTPAARSARTTAPSTGRGAIATGASTATGGSARPVLGATSTRRGPTSAHGTARGTRLCASATPDSSALAGETALSAPPATPTRRGPTSALQTAQMTHPSAPATPRSTGPEGGIARPVLPATQTPRASRSARGTAPPTHPPASAMQAPLAADFAAPRAWRVTRMPTRRHFAKTDPPRTCLRAHAIQGILGRMGGCARPVPPDHGGWAWGSLADCARQGPFRNFQRRYPQRPAGRAPRGRTSQWMAPGPGPTAHHALP